MSLSKTGFIYFAILFYGLSIILLGTIPIDNTIESSSVGDNLGFEAVFISNVSELPDVINFFFFGSLFIGITFALFTTLFGSVVDGGS